MVVISVSLNFPYPARVTLGEASEWARLPSAKAFWRFDGGVRRRLETVTRRAAKPKQNDAEPQGAG